jgi:hypothetical protein
MKSITRGSPNSFSAGISNKLLHCFLFVFLLFSAQCGRLNLADLQPHTPSDWPLYGGDPGRTHAKPIAVSPPFELVWEKKITAAIGQTILHQDGMIFIPTLNGKIDILRLRAAKLLGNSSCLAAPSELSHCMDHRRLWCAAMKTGHPSDRYENRR